ncbi:MAG: thiamine phosphate synthase [Magnetococcales bacterium]|nr:thiamine phosphate synthase [Magnetococcales bacterium]
MIGVHAIRGVLPILDADWLDRLELISATEIRRFQSGRDSVIGTLARCLGASGVSCVQLRCKDQARCTPFATLWVTALRQYAPHIALIINDHVELAVALAADGVHVGQEDTPVATCRRLLGPHKLVGWSTHTPAEILLANQAAVDYVGFGPLFPTHTKPDAQAAQGVDRLAEACRVAQKPVVAIGGIQVGDMAPIAATGASAVAMISGLWEKESWQQRLEQATQAWHNSHL